MNQAPEMRYKTLLYDNVRWEGFKFRPDDIVISTPPKCGTTWTQRICALLIFQDTRLDRPLTDISPWVDMLTKSRDAVFAELESQTHRRFIKTHTPLDGLPYDDRVTYICVGRDPRDAGKSWDGHVMNTDTNALFAAREAAVGNHDIINELEEGPPPMPETEYGRFWEWVELNAESEDIRNSLRGVLHHLSTFWKARDRDNVILLHYGDLKDDLEGQMRALAKRLSIEIPEQRWPQLVEAATFEQMRRDADKVAPEVSARLWQDNKQFFRSGKNGGWKALFNEGDESRYAARVRELVDADLLEWAHHGPIAG